MALTLPLRFEAVGAAFGCALVLAGCGTATTTGTSGGGGSAGAQDNGFVSDNPQGSSNFNGGEDAEGSSSASAGAGGGGDLAAPGAAGGDEAERAISEADIIQMDGNRLYALSQYSGLSIIDITTPDHLALLGRYQAAGMPFEMYLRDGVVYAMFSSWGQYLYDADTAAYSWVQTSRIEALDVTQPSNIEQIGSFDLPGEISDSRMVGDVLYAVSYQDGYCYDCQAQPNTTVTSLSVANPAAIGVVDQLSFAGDDPYGYGWWRRSVTVTPERMYVAGIEWDGSTEGHSTIDIVDISDPAGQLVKGASVQAAGQIESRWQMDEKDGILRVISQPGVWNNGTPTVQTFSVLSSAEVHPLGALDLVLPTPERLRAARFDGTRAYAITAQQTDPLFTIDLTVPSAPVQLAALEMPGWIYYIEPRGDRLYTLGFDNNDAEGSLHVSLFDVADMAAPTLLSRVAFGGQWSNLAEDQDRIHKAFKLVDSLGLLLVPFSAWSYDETDYCSSFESGIQLIDFTHDTLAKRGVAGARGMARRSFVKNDRLFAISDEEVGSFDIADRDAPLQKDTLALAMNVTQTVVVGDKLARLTTDWWSNEAKLEIVLASDPTAEALGSLDLAALLGSDEGCYGWSYYGARAFAHGQQLYLVRSGYDTQTHIDAIDLSDAAAPAVLSSLTLPFSAYNYGWLGGVVSSGDAIVQAGSTLVFRNVTYDYYDPNVTTEEASLEVVDLSDAAHPEHTTVTLPDGSGHTYLVADGSDVLTSHWAPLPGDPTKVRFYVDRLDVSNPGSPVLAAPINVPGSLLSVDGPTGRLLTVDYTHHEMSGVSYEECYDAFGWDASFTSEDPDFLVGDCVGMTKTFKLVNVNGAQATLAASSPLDEGAYVGSVLLGDDRVFLTKSHYSYDGYGTYGLLAVGGMRAGTIEQGSYDLDPYQYAYPIAAAGKRVVMASYSPPAIGVLDTSDLDALTYAQKAEVPSYIYGVTMDGDTALCSMGPYGLQSVDIGN